MWLVSISILSTLSYLFRVLALLCFGLGVTYFLFEWSCLIFGFSSFFFFFDFLISIWILHFLVSLYSPFCLDGCFSEGISFVGFCFFRKLSEEVISSREIRGHIGDLDFFWLLQVLWKNLLYFKLGFLDKIWSICKGYWILVLKYLILNSYLIQFDLYL